MLFFALISNRNYTSTKTTMQKPALLRPFSGKKNSLFFIISFCALLSTTYSTGQPANTSNIPQHAVDKKEDIRGLRIAFLTDIHVSPGAVSEPNLENIVSEINEGDYDFAVVTGDVTNTGLDTELVTVHRILGRLKIPLHIVPGNHETNWSESACQTFPRLWGNDRFCFSADNYLFIGFDTGPFMKMGDGHVKEEDVRWLQQTLAREAGRDKTVISLSH